MDTEQEMYSWQEIAEQFDVEEDCQNLFVLLSQRTTLHAVYALMLCVYRLVSIGNGLEYSFFKALIEAMLQEDSVFLEHLRSHNKLGQKIIILGDTGVQ